MEESMWGTHTTLSMEQWLSQQKQHHIWWVECNQITQWTLCNNNSTTIALMAKPLKFKSSWTAKKTQSRAKWFKLIITCKQVRLLKEKTSLISCYALVKSLSNTLLALKLSRNNPTLNLIWPNKTRSPQPHTKDHKTQWDSTLHSLNQVQEEMASTMHCSTPHRMSNSGTPTVFNINENIVIDN